MANISQCSMRFKTKLPQKNGTIQRVYECCQSTLSISNLQRAVSEMTGRVSRREMMRTKLLNMTHNYIIYVSTSLAMEANRELKHIGEMRAPQLGSRQIIYHFN